MSSSSSMISFMNLKSSTNSKTNNKDPPSVKKERDIRLESGMEGDRHEVAVHSPARNHGNSVRKFWSNGSRPMIFRSGAARIDLLDFNFDQSYCACMPSFRAITRQLALMEKKFSPSNGRFRWLFPRNEVHYSLGLQRKVQLDGRNTRTILHCTN